MFSMICWLNVNIYEWGAAVDFRGNANGITKNTFSN